MPKPLLLIWPYLLATFLKHYFPIFQWFLISLTAKANILTYQAPCDLLFNVTVTQFIPLLLLHIAYSYSLKAPSTLIPQGLCTCYSLCLKHFPQVLKCAHLSSNITSLVRPSLRVLIPFLLCFLPHCNSHDLVLHLYNSL